MIEDLKENKREHAWKHFNKEKKENGRKIYRGSGD